MRRANKYSKFAKYHCDQLKELKIGTKYEIDDAVKVAKN